MKTIAVGMGDLAVSADPNGVLVTYGLGSCIAMLAHDPVRRVAGMIHFMLPLSSITPEKALERPAMFGDTGVALLFERMRALSSHPANWIVKVVGGASIQDDNKYFEIGKRNYVQARKVLWTHGIAIRAEAVGGRVSRTTKLFVADGRATVRASDSFNEVEL